MGILSTRWEGEHQGHRVAVVRNELTKGFAIEWDGEVIAERSWSWIGHGKLTATAELGGEPVEIRSALGWGGAWGGLAGKCTVHVGDAEVPMTRTK